MARSKAVFVVAVLGVATFTLIHSGEESHLLPALTPVPLVIDAEISSNANKTGDRFPLHVAEDVKEGDLVLIPAGSLGEGEVVHAARSKGGGRAGELILAARFVTVGDKHVRLRSFSAASGNDRTGASIGSSVAIGLFAMLVRGSDLIMPAGTAVSARTAEDVQLRAVAKAAGDAPPSPSQTSEEPVNEHE